MLVDHTNTLRDRLSRRGKVYRLAVHQNFAFFRTVQAGQNIHQGAFASAILSEQGMYFTLTEIKIYMIVGQHPGESFDDSAHADDIFVIRSVLTIHRID